MKTKIKERKFHPGEYYSEEELKTGVYFKSKNDISSFYLIELQEGNFKGNVIVNIYTTGVPINHFDTKGLVKGCTIYMPDYDVELQCTLDLSPKYFFPKFNNDMQLYYDEKKYYNGKYKSDSIASLFECINYAIYYGLKEAAITPY